MKTNHINNAYYMVIANAYQKAFARFAMWFGSSAVGKIIMR